MIVTNKIRETLFGKKVTKAKKGIDSDLKKDTILIYLNNIKIIKSLEEDFGFKSFFYWQPSVFTKTPLSEFEKNIILEDEFPGEFYVNVTKDITTYKEIKDLSNIFDNYSKTIFIDDFHTSEEGNKIIAEQIGSDVLNYLKSKNITSKNAKK